MTIGQSVEEGGQLQYDRGVQVRKASSQLWPPECRDADLGEQHAACPVGGKFDEEKVQTARECALGIEHIEFCAQRVAQFLDHLIDGCDQEVFFRHKVMVHKAGGEIGLGRDTLNGCSGEAVLEDGAAQTRNDLAAARSGQTRASHG